MKRLVHNYLSRNYKINKKVILFKENKCVTSSDQLHDELNEIFELERKILKRLIKSWVHKENLGFDFNRWWIQSRYIAYENQNLCFGIDMSNQILNYSSIFTHMNERLSTSMAIPNELISTSFGSSSFYQNQHIINTTVI